MTNDELLKERVEALVSHTYETGYYSAKLECWFHDETDQEIDHETIC